MLSIVDRFGRNPIWLSSDFLSTILDNLLFIRIEKILYTTFRRGTAAAQWLRHCATNREVAGSIPAGVSGFFIDIKSFRSHYGPGFDSASNRNEY